MRDAKCELPDAISSFIFICIFIINMRIGINTQTQIGIANLLDLLLLIIAVKMDIDYQPPEDLVSIRIDAVSPRISL